MAVDMFLKIDGIKGESHDKTHKDEIEIQSISWGASQSGTFGSGGGGGAGKVNMNDVHFVKYADKASSALFLHCCSGKHIPSALITFRKAGDKPLEYLKIKLTDLLVSSVQFSGSGGDDRVHESLSINFSKYEQEYFMQKPDGSGEPTGNVGWDVKANHKV